MAYLHNPAPVYPAMSRKLGEQGVVKLRILVSAEGIALSMEIVESSGHERLDNAALRAVRGWRFVPARQDGRAISAYAIVPIEFERLRAGA